MEADEHAKKTLSCRGGGRSAGGWRTGHVFAVAIPELHRGDSGSPESRCRSSNAGDPPHNPCRAPRAGGRTPVSPPGYAEGIRPGPRPYEYQRQWLARRGVGVRSRRGDHPHQWSTRCQRSLCGRRRSGVDALEWICSGRRLAVGLRCTRHDALERIALFGVRPGAGERSGDDAHQRISSRHIRWFSRRPGHSLERWWRRRWWRRERPAQPWRLGPERPQRRAPTDSR